MSDDRDWTQPGTTLETIGEILDHLNSAMPGRAKWASDAAKLATARVWHESLSRFDPVDLWAAARSIAATEAEWFPTLGKVREEASRVADRRRREIEMRARAAGPRVREPITADEARAFVAELVEKLGTS